MSTRRGKKKKKNVGISGDLPGDVLVLSGMTYEITDEPIRDRDVAEPPEAIKETLQRIYEKIHSRPEEVLDELLELKKRYEGVPVLYNFLFNVYAASGDMENAESVNKECLARFPRYLFGRVNHAMICLKKGEYAKVPGIFEHKFDLKELYPRRSVFHISEFVYFNGALAMYFAAIGERRIAREHYKAIKKAAPDHSMTRQLKKLLYPGILGMIFEKLDSRE